MTLLDESLEARVAIVETELKSHGRQLGDHSRRLDGFGVMADSVIRLTESFVNLRDDMSEIKNDFKEDKKNREDREDDVRRTNLQIKIVLWTILAMVICAVIGAIAVIVAAGGIH